MPKDVQATAFYEPILFDAILYPHRSLSGLAMVMVVAGMSLIFLTIGGFFLAMGAWPIFGFFGLDAVLVAFAFWLSKRQGQLHETVRLTASHLRIERVHPSGRRLGWDFQPGWTRVELTQPPGHDPRLSLFSKGKQLVIGQFLSAQERCDFARALRQALTGSRR